MILTLLSCQTGHLIFIKWIIQLGALFSSWYWYVGRRSQTLRVETGPEQLLEHD